VADQLWRLPEREYRYAAVDLLESVDIQASQMMAAASATKEAKRCASLS